MQFTGSDRVIPVDDSAVDDFSSGWLVYGSARARDRGVRACALGGNGEFVVDVHTHHVTPDGPWTKNAPETVQLVLGMVAACSSSNQLECANRAVYLHDLFLASDTTVAMLSDVPNYWAGRMPRCRLRINSAPSSSPRSSPTAAHREYSFTT